MYISSGVMLLRNVEQVVYIWLDISSLGYVRNGVEFVYHLVSSVRSQQVVILSKS